MCVKSIRLGIWAWSRVGLALRPTKQCYPTIILGFGVVYCPKSPILKVRDLTQIWHKFDTHFAHLWDLGFGRGRGLGMVGLALRTTKQCYPTIILGFGVVYCPKSPILKVRDLTQIWNTFRESWDLGFGRGRGLGMVCLALRNTKQWYPIIILSFGVVYRLKSPSLIDLTHILRIYETWDLGVVEGWGWLVWHSEPLNNVIQP